VDVVLRAIIIYLLVFVFTRALGRRELATLPPFDLILLEVICDLIQSGVPKTTCRSPAWSSSYPRSPSCRGWDLLSGFRVRRLRPF
jgi:hypothetical protein